jgi:hypothetical protein
MVSSCHLTVIRFPLNNVNPARLSLARSTLWHSDLDLHVFEQVGATMLSIECLHPDPLVVVRVGVGAALTLDIIE